VKGGVQFPGAVAKLSTGLADVEVTDLCTECISDRQTELGSLGKSWLFLDEGQFILWVGFRDINYLSPHVADV